MKTIRIGIICPSEIAFRRFLPSLKQVEGIEYAGVAVANEAEWNGTLTDAMKQSELAKAQNFVDTYGGKIFDSYHALLTSDEVDAIYLPLPPALHYQWAKLAIANNKHVFVEKPSTTSYADSSELIALASEKRLALHENYMFQYHSQIDDIIERLNDGAIGRVHSYHARFGFPMRAQNDFRYNKALGGGALLDAGGYVIKLATRLLGDSIKLRSASLKTYSEDGVDMYGSYMFTNDAKETFFGEFGMDNEYQCSLNVWGSEGILSTDRIFTAPDELKPVLNYRKKGQETSEEVACDSHFVKSIKMFTQAVNDEETRNRIYQQIAKQAQLVDDVKASAMED